MKKKPTKKQQTHNQIKSKVDGFLKHMNCIKELDMHLF